MVLPADLLPFYVWTLSGLFALAFLLCALAEYRSWRRKYFTPHSRDGGGIETPGSAGNSRG